MNRFLSLLLTAGSAMALLSPTDVSAQRNSISAQEAVDLVSSNFGPKSIQWIAEIRGRSGVPQPSDWEVLTFDQRMPRLLYRFWATAGRVVDGGPDEERYPLNIPVGYFNMAQVGVDSVAAFTIAEGEARKAKMAFDSCDYLLRVREYSTEPIWRLELFDARQQIVGKIYISANTGAVRRTVWIYRDTRSLAGGVPRIVDSMAPNQAGVGTGLTSAPAPSQLYPSGPRPGESTGIVQMQPPAGPQPGQQSGIAQAPARPAPRFQENMIPAPPVPNAPGAPQPGAPQPYRPVDSNGNVIDNSIPDPPAVSGSEMRDLRDAPASEPAAKPDPTRPPIEVPTTGGGSSERIPPPPIPQ
ncbi:MAG: hypothetical protein P1U85_18075 [Verrucomicrobiales bacterium]|jgi:hypothetical protein|nr:hypothetical protein [Verrucomicrobiales bacterium]